MQKILFVLIEYLSAYILHDYQYVMLQICQCFKNPNFPVSVLT